MLVGTVWRFGGWGAVCGLSVGIAGVALVVHLMTVRGHVQTPVAVEGA